MNPTAYVTPTIIIYVVFCPINKLVAISIPLSTLLSILYTTVLFVNRVFAPLAVLAASNRMFFVEHPVHPLTPYHVIADPVLIVKFPFKAPVLPNPNYNV